MAYLQTKSPMIHKCLWENLYQPFSRKGLYRIDSIKWSVHPKSNIAKQFDFKVYKSTDSKIKFMALILADFKN